MKCWRKWTKNKIPLLKNWLVNAILLREFSQSVSFRMTTPQDMSWFKCLTPEVKLAFCIFRIGSRHFRSETSGKFFPKISFEKTIATYTTKIQKLLYKIAAWETYLSHDLFSQAQTELDTATRLEDEKMSLGGSWLEFWKALSLNPQANTLPYKKPKNKQTRKTSTCYIHSLLYFPEDGEIHVFYYSLNVQHV